MEPYLSADQEKDAEPLNLPGGIPVHCFGKAKVLEIVARAVHESRQLHIVMVNVETTQHARGSREFCELLKTDTLNIPDSVGICSALLLLHGVRTERIPGPDLMRNLLCLAMERDWKVFILGARPEVCEVAVSRISLQFPGVVGGYHHGYFRDCDLDSIASQVTASGSRVVLVAMSSPQQDRLIAKLRQKVSSEIFLGVGGALDIEAGILKRAPLWVRVLGAEWLYRLAQEPSRLRRQMAIPRFLIQLAAGMFAHLKRGR